MDIGGATELSRLIRELGNLIDTNNKSITQPFFAAHSEADATAAIDRIESLVKKSDNVEMFRIGKNFAVPHASVVLKNSIFSINNSPLKANNPFFSEMMSSVNVFAVKHNLI